MNQQQLENYVNKKFDMKVVFATWEHGKKVEIWQLRYYLTSETDDFDALAEYASLHFRNKKFD